MGRIVVNKHFSDTSKITIDKFVNKGELIISNEPGFEGIYILNDNGNIIDITSKSGATAVSEEVKEFLREHYLTSAQTLNIITELSGNVYSALQTAGDENVQSDWNVTNTDSDAYIKNKPTIYGEAEIKGMAAEEVAKIVASADTNFDTLKEIADWISSDTTGAAKMANDIAELSAATQSVKSSDHVVLTYAEYTELITNGYVIKDEKTITYNNDVFYCIMDNGSSSEEEEEEESEGSGAEIDETTNELVVSGDALVDEANNILTIDNVVIDENGVLQFLAVENEEEAEINDNTNEMVVNDENIDSTNNILSFVNNSTVDEENNILTINI